MCGLILAPDRFGDRSIQAALAEMSYRGADGQWGMTRTAGFVLGHVRLAIQTDPYDEESAQPFESEQGALAFVGEVFSDRGVGLFENDIPEVEVLRHVLRTPNLEGFMDLDGFWSIAEVRHDGRARVITDHLGIKPLYFWPEHGIVCSELDPMFQLVPRPPADEVYLSNCIKFGYDYSGRTPYQGITQIAPGTALVFGEEFDPLQPYSYNYWKWDRVPTAPLREALEKATVLRAGSSNRAVSLLLSGGLDSSIIYHLLKRKNYDVYALAVENGESEFLPAGVEVLMPPEQPDYEDAVRVMQAPLDLGSLFPQVQLARSLATAGTHVCLSGDGADEVFGGYSRAMEYDSQGSDVFCELPYYHLPRLDRVLMRSTIELRSPFLAPSVVAYGLRLPWHRRQGKNELKKVFGDLLPARILNRPKHPLKSASVLLNPLAHRAKLVEVFRAVHYRTH